MPCRKIGDKRKMRDRFVKKCKTNILDVKINYAKEQEKENEAIMEKI